MDELITAQLHDPFCSDVCRRLNERKGLAFEFDENGLLVRTATHDHTIVVPHSLKKRVLWLNHYTTFAGHPRGTHPESPRKQVPLGNSGSVHEVG